MADRNQRELAAWVDSFQSFSEILDSTAKAFPERIFLIEGERRWSYRDFNELVTSCHYYFRDHGIESGDVISVILRNSIDYLILYFAALRSRVIINPFPFHLNAQEVLEKVADISPKIIFCHKEHGRALLNFQYRVRNLDACEAKTFAEELKRYPRNTFPSSGITEGQTAVLYYSSGTTGKPKIIEYTHKSMVATQASMLRSNFTLPGSIHLCVLPLGHTAALRYTIKQCICTASTVVLYESFWKIRGNLWREIEKHGVTFMEVVPTILIAILNTPYKDFSVKQVKTMRFIGCGSAFLPQKLQEDFEGKYGVPVANLYGLSETAATHFDNPELPGRKTGNIGKPFDVFDAKIFDEKGIETPVGKTGELGIKGIGILKDYYKNHEFFLSCLHDGYFMTGDLARKDEEGFYYYVDRKKDLIIKGGVNIVPSQIDDVLLCHPAIEDAATIGKPDMFLGETIKSFVVLKNGRVIDKKEVMSYCKEKLGAFKTPSEIEVIEALPKGPSGKILKRKLREQEFSRA